jgi:molybdenum cofactor biosynthesis protein B
MSHIQHQSTAATIRARCAVITLSDTRTPETDTSGRRIIDLLTAAGHTAEKYHVMKDDPALLQPVLENLLAGGAVDVVLTTGGTGISRRDATIAVVESLLDQPLPGFGELFRMLSWQEIGSSAMLSRAIGGIAGGKPVFAMPGSTAAAELAMTKLILPEIGHLLGELRK